MERLTERKWTSKDNTQPTLVLENCAHCGGMAEFVNINNGLVIGERDGVSKVAVKCHTCGIATPYFELKTKAVAIWNRRVK